MRPRKEELPGWFSSDQLASRVRGAGAPHPADSGNLQTGTGAVNLEGARVRQKSGWGQETGVEAELQTQGKTRK